MKSTFVMGASSVITIFLGIIRNKFFALVLGPSGFGIIGIYQSITSLISSSSGLGISESGVRQIAVASQSQDKVKIDRTIITLRRVVSLTGTFGVLILILLSRQIGLLSFGDSRHNQDLILLSATILLGAISGGQAALIQGMRRIKDLAKLTILSAFFTTLCSIPIIYLFKEQGLVYFLLAQSVITLLTTWYFSRKIKIETAAMRWRDTWLEARPLLTLGLALMLGSLIITGTQYLIRVIVIRNLGLSAAGIYQASETLSSFYVGILLTAMIADYYPRLSSASHDNSECRFLIDKQVEVGVLFAIPGVLATMILAPLVIPLFYSSKFIVAVSLLRWQILGVFLQVVSWPMGFIFRAKGEGKLFVWTEVVKDGIYLCLAWLGIREFGLTGVGIAFFGTNLVYLFLIYFIVRRKYSFSFSRANAQLLCIGGAAIMVIFLTPLLFHGGYLLINLCIMGLAGVFCIKRLFYILGTRSLSSILGFFRSRHLS